MAASTLANLEAGLRRIYSDETFDYAQAAAAPLVELFEEVEDLTPDGEGYYWPFMLVSPQNIGTPGEAGNLPTAKQRTEIQGRLRAGQFVGDFEISFMLEAAGSERGTWSKNEVKKHSWETLRDLVKHRNRIYAGTYGTGVLATVAATTGAANAFVAKLTASGTGRSWGSSGQGASLLRKNMLIDVVTGGGATEIAARKITAIAKATRTITFDGAATVVTLDSGVYITGSYNQSTVPNGLMGLVDDGGFLDVLHNQSRTTYPELKAQTFHNSGTYRDISEDLLLIAGFSLRQEAGGQTDVLVMNTDQLYKYIKAVRPTRYFDANGRAPKYSAGFDNESTFKFYFDGRPIRIITSEDVAPRHVYGLDLSTMRRATLKKLGWLDHGGGSMFIQGSNSSGYTTTKVATMYSLENIATLAPWMNWRIEDLMAPNLAGAAVGGTDT